MDAATDGTEMTEAELHGEPNGTDKRMIMKNLNDAERGFVHLDDKAAVAEFHPYQRQNSLSDSERDMAIEQCRQELLATERQRMHFTDNPMNSLAPSTPPPQLPPRRLGRSIRPPTPPLSRMTNKRLSMYDTISNEFRSGRPRAKFLLCLVAVCSISACLVVIACIYYVNMPRVTYEDPPNVCLTQECVKTAAFLLAGMDQMADPCEDFFQYACGLWNNIHIIPEDKGSINTFEVLADQLQIVIRRLLEEQPGIRDNAVSIKAKKLYWSCMDASKTMQNGTYQILRIISWLGGWPVINGNWTVQGYDLEILLASLKLAYNQGVIIEQWIGPDDKNSSVNVLQIDQPTLGLPGREYFLKANGSPAIQAYHKFMTDVAVKLGADRKNAGDELQKIIEFETRLAHISVPESDRQDTSHIYRKLNLDELQDWMTQFNWKKYFYAYLNMRLDSHEPIVSYSQPYFRNLGYLLKITDKRIVHNYVIWRMLMDVVLPLMSDDYQHIYTAFKGVLFGISSERDRWSQCVELTNRKLGMGVGSLFIQDNFSPESKESALEMIRTIREAFNELIDENEWMDETTKAVAKEKANAMNERIGYPESLTDIAVLEMAYADLEIEDNFLMNVMNILRFESEQIISRLRQPVDPDKWATEPAIVNAFYNPNKNDIVFPAGILQPFFYNKHFPQSVNYGGIGVVIGHEITHGFDDKGRQFDKDGNMKEWWDNGTIRAFRKQAQCIIDQYSAYKIDEIGMYLNGKITQGENIADNGGLKQAFRAYKKYVAQNGPEPLLPGLDLSHEQIFFLNYAQIWCGTMRPEDALAKVRSAAHAPGKMRVIGPLSNSKEFAVAYKCPPDSKMNPKKKCNVW